MKEIKNFFDKFRSGMVEKVKIHTFISEIIKNETGIVLDPADISISEGKIKIKSSQAFKNEIYIKKNKILSMVENNFPNTPINDIG